MWIRSNCLKVLRLFEGSWTKRRFYTWTMALKPSEMEPIRMALRVVPTSSSCPSTSAMVRTAPKFSGIWFILFRNTSQPEASWEDLDLHGAGGVCVHLALLLGRQVHTPADDLAVFATSTEESTPTQRAQSEHAALVGPSLSHDLVGLW